MDKITAEKELLHVVNDILNPYNEREAEIEAYLLAEEGWRKVPQAEWIVTEKEDYWIPDITVKSTRPVYKCSVCEKEFGLIASKYSYCPNCGAEMVGRK